MLMSDVFCVCVCVCVMGYLREFSHSLTSHRRCASFFTSAAASVIGEDPIGGWGVSVCSRDGTCVTRPFRVLPLLH